jgi:hypothetical protein
MSDTENTRTRLIQRTDLPWGGSSDNPQPTDYGDPTRKIDARDVTMKTPAQGGSGGPSSPDDNRTVFMGRPGKKNDPMDDPVAGWLAIIKGPGRGAAVKIGYQINSIGREADNGNRIVLNFGDMGISRANHAEIIYDPKNRKFYAGRTGGSNLTYINDSPLLQTHELNAGDILQLGETHLRFVPFCGPDFDWTAPEAEETKEK